MKRRYEFAQDETDASHALDSGSAAGGESQGNPGTRLPYDAWRAMSLDAKDMQFIENLFRSLEKEMQQRFAEADQRADERFHQLSSRLDLVNERLHRIDRLVMGGERFW